MSARMRSGHRAWEVDHLYLAGEGPAPPARENRGHADADSASPELLERLAQAVGWRCGERIFLRLSPDSPAIPLARRGGFFPHFHETRLEGWGGHSPAGGAAPPEGLRQLRPEDRFPLFQLFAAATPPRQREVLGLTFDQWQDSQERPSPGGQDWVMEHRGRITGWLRLSHRGGVMEGEVMTHPDYPALLPGLMQVALVRPGWQRWWVPSYRERVAEQLQAKGLQRVSQCTMFIKTVAALVPSPGMAPVEA